MAIKESNLKSWDVLEHQDILVVEPWIKVARQKIQISEGKVIDDYHQIQLPDFVVIVAKDRSGKVLIERQYRHGIGQVTLVLPGGMKEAGEDPLVAAQRELLEETGYVAENWRNLGSYVANANYRCGEATLFLAENAHQVTEANSGDLEEIELLLLSPEEVFAAVRQGQMTVMGAVMAVAVALNPLLSQA
jgi:ADP-ribose pyrophosphatase